MLDSQGTNIRKNYFYITQEQPEGEQQILIEDHSTTIALLDLQTYHWVIVLRKSDGIKNFLKPGVWYSSLIKTMRYFVYATFTLMLFIRVG